MHELSLCGAMAETALEHAAGRPIERIRLRIGHFRQVVPATLQFCWEVRVDGTALEGCALDVDYIAAQVSCNGCHSTTTLEHPLLLCGSCGGADVTMTSGDEFLLESIEVRSAPAKEVR